MAENQNSDPKGSETSAPKSSEANAPSSASSGGQAKASSSKTSKKSKDDGSAQAAGFGARGLNERKKAELVDKVNGPEVNKKQVEFAKNRTAVDRSGKDTKDERRSLPEPRLRAVDSDDPTVGWTAQHAVPRVEVEATPGQVFRPEELPTAQGLKDVGVTDPAAFLAGLPVVEKGDDDLVKERTDSRPGAHPEFKRVQEGAVAK